MFMRYLDILQKARKRIVIFFLAATFTVFAVTLPVFASDVAGLPEELFDIRLTIDSPEIESTQDLTARAEFTSFGRVPTSVALTWVVRDADGVEVYRSAAETLVVETELAYPRRFVEMATLATGTYTLSLTTTYRDDVVDEFSQSFTVEESSDDILPFVIIGFMTLVGVLWVAYFLRHHHGHVSHERMIAITSRAAVFLVAGAILPAAGLLVSENVNVSTQRGTVYMGSLGLRTVSDTTSLLAYTQKTNETYEVLKKVIAYGNDEVVRATAQELPLLTALYILDEEAGVAISMQRAFDWSLMPSTEFAMPRGEGLVQANDTTWSGVARFPRAEGGWYIVQVSFDTEIAELATRTHKDEDALLVDADGVVLAATKDHTQGESIATQFPDMWGKMQNNEYFEGVCDAHHLFTSRRVYLSTGDSYRRYYLVTRGHYEQLSASVHFAF